MEHHYEGSSYPRAFCLVLVKKIGEHRIDIEKRNILIRWVNTKIGFDVLLRDRLIRSFKQPKKEDTTGQSAWKSEVLKSLEGRGIKECIAFLEYGKSLLRENYDLHLLSCTLPGECHINVQFEARIQAVDQLIEHCQAQQREEAEKTPLSLTPIRWLGTQKQLAELLVELEKKGWIEKPTYDTIKATFTNSNSIQQVLKPSQNSKTKEKTYEHIYTAKYTPSFYGIKENKKKGK